MSVCTVVANFMKTCEQKWSVKLKGKNSGTLLDCIRIALIMLSKSEFREENSARYNSQLAIYLIYFRAQ